MAKTTYGSLVKRGRVFHARWTVGGKVFTSTTGMTKESDALIKMKSIVAPYARVGEVEALERATARLGGRKAEVAKWAAEQNPPPKIGEVLGAALASPVWNRFLESPGRPDSGESTLRQYEAEFKRFVAWITDRHPGVVFLHQVTRQHAEQYAADMQAAKVSASTFNQHRNLLRLVWRVMADSARLTVNPWDSITPRKLNALGSRKQALTPGQYDSLLLATEDDTDMHDLFIVLAWTGLRLVDAVTLKWGAVDFKRGVLTVAPQKTSRRTGKQVHIPMFPAVREVLDRREAGRPVNPAGYVFPALVEEYDRDAGATLSKRVGAAFTRAGIVTKGERADRARNVTLYGAHSFRHFFVTVAASAGMPGAMIKSITGHSTDAMQDHYVQIGADMAADIASRMTCKALPAAGATEGGGDADPALLGALAGLVEAHGARAVQDALTGLVG